MERSNWMLEDQDDYLIVREVGLGVFEMYQLNSVPSTAKTERFEISHGLVSLSEVDVHAVLECYGYDSLQEFRSDYADTSDRMLAEYAFALDAHSGDYRISGCMDWRNAVAAIKTMAGINE